MSKSIEWFGLFAREDKGRLPDPPSGTEYVVVPEDVAEVICELSENLKMTRNSFRKPHYPQALLALKRDHVRVGAQSKVALVNARLVRLCEEEDRAVLLVSLRSPDIHKLLAKKYRDVSPENHDDAHMQLFWTEIEQR
jgi:hypothetical protein